MIAEMCPLPPIPQPPPQAVYSRPAQQQQQQQQQQQALQPPQQPPVVAQLHAVQRLPAPASAPPLPSGHGVPIPGQQAAAGAQQAAPAAAGGGIVLPMVLCPLTGAVMHDPVVDKEGNRLCLAH